MTVRKQSHRDRFLMQLASTLASQVGGAGLSMLGNYLSNKQQGDTQKELLGEKIKAQELEGERERYSREGRQEASDFEANRQRGFAEKGARLKEEAALPGKLAGGLKGPGRVRAMAPGMPYLSPGGLGSGSKDNPSSTLPPQKEEAGPSGDELPPLEPIRQGPTASSPEEAKWLKGDFSEELPWPQMPKQTGAPETRQPTTAMAPEKAMPSGEKFQSPSVGNLRSEEFWDKNKLGIPKTPELGLQDYKGKIQEIAKDTPANYGGDTIGDRQRELQSMRGAERKARSTDALMLEAQRFLHSSILQGQSRDAARQQLKSQLRAKYATDLELQSLYAPEELDRIVDTMPDAPAAQSVQQAQQLSKTRGAIPAGMPSKTAAPGPSAPTPKGTISKQQQQEAIQSMGLPAAMAKRVQMMKEGWTFE